AGWEPRQDRLTLSDRCASVQVLGANTGLYELVADMDRVLDTDSEADRPPALAVLQPVLDHVPDQVVGVHATLKLTDNVVALLSSNATEIGIDRRIDSRPHQEAAHDQVRDLRALDHGLEDVAEASTVPPDRCGGQPDDDRVGIGIEHLLIAACPRVMRFIDNQVRRRRHRHPVRSDGPSVQRLDAGNLDVGIGPQFVLKAGENDAGIDAIGDQLVAGLRDDLAPMGNHQNAVVALDRAIDDLRAYDGLAGPRGGDVEQPAPILRDFALDLIDGVPLEGMQLDRDVLLEEGTRRRVMTA